MKLASAILMLCAGSLSAQINPYPGAWMKPWNRASATPIIGIDQMGVGIIIVTEPPYYVSTNSIDNSASLNAALATCQTVYIPPGIYPIANEVDAVCPGQTIIAGGKDVAWLSVNTNFNMAARGQLVFLTGEPGPQIHGLGIMDYQPNTSNRTSLIQYPPAYYAVSCPRFVLDNCKIQGAWNGILMTNNSGGAVINFLEQSGFNIGIWIDGAEDTVRIHQWHYWPFGFSGGTLEYEFNLTNNIALYTARCDDLILSDCLMISGGQMVATNAGPGQDTFATVTGTDFDTFGVGLISDGLWNFAGDFFSVGHTGFNAFHATGGNITVAGSTFILGADTTVPLIVLEGAPSVGKNELMLSGDSFITDNFDERSLSVTGYLWSVNLTGGNFFKTQGIDYTNPVIYTGNIGGTNSVARLLASSNFLDDSGTNFNAGTNIFFDITVDSAHRIIGNASPGWTNLFPNAVSGVYQFN